MNDKNIKTGDSRSGYIADKITTDHDIKSKVITDVNGSQKFIISLENILNSDYNFQGTIGIKTQLKPTESGIVKTNKLNKAINLSFTGDMEGHGFIDGTNSEVDIDIHVTNPPCSTCTGTCTNTCTGSCVNTCTGTCSGGCQGTCSGGCSGCTGSCSGSCSGGCSGGCTSCSGCSGGCTGCGDSCSHSCSGTCSGSCTGCSGTCYSACAYGCSSGCAGCTGGCGGTCQSACVQSCDTSCTSSGGTGP